MTKRKFRTRYDTMDFDDSSKGGGGSMTDQSDYVTTEELLKRFLSGQPVKAGNTPVYDYENGENDDEVFRDFEEQNKLEAELALQSEENVMKKRAEVLARVKGSKKSKKGGAQADLSPAPAGKAEQAAPEQAPVPQGQE